MRRLPPSAEWRRSRRRFTSGAGQAAGAAAPEPQREEAPAGRRRPAARQVPRAGRGRRAGGGGQRAGGPGEAGPRAAGRGDESAQWAGGARRRSGCPRGVPAGRGARAGGRWARVAPPAPLPAPPPLQHCPLGPAGSRRGRRAGVRAARRRLRPPRNDRPAGTEHPAAGPFGAPPFGARGRRAEGTASRAPGSSPADRGRAGLTSLFATFQFSPSVGKLRRLNLGESMGG